MLRYATSESMPPAKKKKASKKKAKAKKSAKKTKARKVHAELVSKIKSASDAAKVTDVATFKARMTHYWHCTKTELKEANKDPSTPAYDLVILRMLADIIDFGNVQTLQFYLDIIIGDAKLIGGISGDSGDDCPVTVFQIPANSSESLDEDGDDGF